MSSQLRSTPPGSTQTDVPVGSQTPRADHENMVTRRVAVSCELGGGGWQKRVIF